MRTRELQNSNSGPNSRFRGWVLFGRKSPILNRICQFAAEENQRRNHLIWPPKRVLQFPRAIVFLFLLAAFPCFSAAEANLQAKNASPLIVLDAGHGGTDEGTKALAFQEKKITLITTLMVRKFLDEMGYKVILTRSRDISLSLARRVAIANKNRAALFVSIHYNSAPNASAHGVEVFYYNGGAKERARNSQQLANCILYHLIDETSAHSRGVKKGNWYVTRETQMPAVLVEGGFLSNKEERLQLKKKEHLEKVAKGIAHGIDKYLKKLY